MTVYRHTPTEECKHNIVKQIMPIPPGEPPGLFRNPVDQELWVELRQAHQPLRIEVFNAEGRLALEVTITGVAGEIFHVSVGSLASGVYMARMTAAGQSRIRRFFKNQQFIK